MNQAELVADARAYFEGSLPLARTAHNDWSGLEPPAAAQEFHDFGLEVFRENLSLTQHTITALENHDLSAFFTIATRSFEMDELVERLRKLHAELWDKAQ